MTTAQQMETWRLENNLTKKEFARRLGVGEVYLGKILNGQKELTPGVAARFEALIFRGPEPPAHQQVIPLMVRFTAEEWADLQRRVPPGTDLEELIRGELLSRVLTRARSYVDQVLMAEEDTDSE